MTKKVFEKPFDLSAWNEVLTGVFGARQLLREPRPIELPANDKAQAAFELGSFTTADDRVIGLYHIKLADKVWIEKNRVGLRELLRNVYKYDVDAALIVFEQGQKWRLSYVSEIKVLNDEGEIVKQATEPKRYTYLLGDEEKVQTAAIRLSGLSGRELSLYDLTEAFSVEALNTEFYRTVAAQFYRLIGGKLGKGSKGQEYDGVIQLPGVPKEDHKTLQEFGVRLIGRTVFCWFLKMKRSAAGKALVPEKLLSSQAVKNNPSYYHTVLERLFFQTLNTPMDKRIEGLPEGCEDIPFLNGGLFEPAKEDYYQADKTTGLSQYINTLKVPDEWFLSFFGELEKYNFTLDENTVTDVEVSVDPEMLGRIFENLLAEINPETGETARKATGSFYTPREVVDYMATESLVQHLHNQTGLEADHLRLIFKMTDEGMPDFSSGEKEQILNVLDKVKVLDPACGSGAFPMGVLQKIVTALQKLDEDAQWWIKKRVREIPDSTAKQGAREKLQNNPEYARKIGIIQNSLYGVDIQPIAAEISKLRCFLTLIVDENIEDNHENRGILALPNLEFKFVAADTTRRLPVTVQSHQTGDLFNDQLNNMDTLKELRAEYLQSFGDKKQQIKKEFTSIQQRIGKDLASSGAADADSRAALLSSWNPFSHKEARWFDPEWMFGVEHFDLVIGNPPYLRLQGLDPELVKRARENYVSAKRGNWDMYVLFDERGYELLSEGGILAYIQPHKFFQAGFGAGLRGYLADAQCLMKVVHFGAEQVFNSATNYTCLLFLEKKKRQDFEFVDASTPYAWKQAYRAGEGYQLPQPRGKDKWHFTDPETQALLDKMARQPQTLEDVTRKIFQGIATSADKIYVLRVLEEKTDTYRVYSQQLEEELDIEKGLVKPFLMGKDVKRYEQPEYGNVVVFPYLLKDGKAQLMSQEYIQKNFPKGWNYIRKTREDLEARERGRMKHDEFYAYIYPKNLTEFEAVKIMTRDIANGCEFTLDTWDHYHTTTVYSFVFKEGIEENPEYWLGLLNSKLMWFFLQATGNVLRGGYFRFKTEYLRPFHVRRINWKSEEDKQAHDVICILVSYVLYLRREEKNINDYVSNRHIATLFEEVIDALFMELYFKEDFEGAGRGFARYAARDFKALPPEGDGDKVIHQAYQHLREKENVIRNNLKLMDMKLEGIVKPLKTA